MSAFLGAVLVLAQIAASPPANAPTTAAPKEPAAVVHTIPPGQEKLLQSALDPAIPGGWKFEAAAIQKTDIVLRFERGAEKVVLNLVHKSVASPSALAGGPFAVEIANPSAAGTAVATQVAQRLRRLDKTWKWVEQGDSLSEKTEKKDDGQPRTSSPPPRPVVGNLESRDEVLDLLRRAHHELDAADPESARARVGEIHAAWKKGQPEGALMPAWLLFETGVVLQRAGAEEGKGVLEQALDQEKLRMTELKGEELLSMTTLYARTLVRLGRKQEAHEAIEQMKAAVEGDASCSLAETGRTLGTTEGSFEEGVALLEWIIGRAKMCSKAYVGLAEVCRAAKQYDRAGPLLEQGAKLLPDDIAAVSSLANYRKFQGRRDEATQLLEELARKGHAEAGLLGELIGLYTKSGIPESSLQYFIEAADKDESNLVASFFAGVLLHYRIKGSKEKRDPSTPKGAYARSDKYLHRAEEAFKTEPRLFIYLAMNRYHEGDLTTAAGIINRAVRIGPSDPDVYYCRAMIGMDENPRLALKDFGRYRALTKDAFDKNPGKEKFVLGIIETLESCIEAKVPSQCIEQKETVAKAASWGKTALIGVIALAVGFFFVRRRKSGAAAAALLLAFGAADARADTPPPAAAELLKGEGGAPFLVGEEGWRLETKVPTRPDRVIVRFENVAGERLEIQLEAKGSMPSPAAQTPSFDVSHHGLNGKEEGTPKARLFHRALEAIRRNDPGTIHLSTSTTIPRVGPQVPHTLDAQLSWMSPLDLVLVAETLLLLIAALFFWPSSPTRYSMSSAG